MAEVTGRVPSRSGLRRRVRRARGRVLFAAALLCALSAHGLRNASQSALSLSRGRVAQTRRASQARGRGGRSGGTEPVLPPLRTARISHTSDAVRTTSSGRRPSLYAQGFGDRFPVALVLSD